MSRLKELRKYIDKKLAARYAALKKEFGISI